MTGSPTFDVVVPTIGRASLERVLDALLVGEGPLPASVTVVDDRPAGLPPLRLPASSSIPVSVRRSYGAGPAAARNAGWAVGRADWVAFLDDDVEPPRSWRDDLAADLRAVHADDRVVGSQARIVVPRPDGRPPTDRERDVGGLSGARFATADLAYRRRALEAVGGFDERFRRAYREDSDIALQFRRRGGRIVRGERSVVHPVAPAPWSVSIGRQRGNADDALMRRRYGRDWRHLAAAFPTRLRMHLLTTASAGLAVGALGLGRRRVAIGAATVWAGATLGFLIERARFGSKDPRELAALAVTSVAIPPVAVGHRLRGEIAVLRDARAGLHPAQRVGPNARPRAVLFDRDGTLVHDVPYNGDPARVRVVDGARDALAALRAAGLIVAVVTNQSGIARGVLSAAQVRAVHRRIEAELGPFSHWAVCPHGPDDACRCRKPAPGLVVATAAALGLRPAQCVVIGDTEADVAAARAAGARGIMVANRATRVEEVDQAPESAASLRDAVDRVLEVV